MTSYAFRIFINRHALRIRHQSVRAACALFVIVLGASLACPASAAPEKKPAPPPDVLVLSDGDILHGKFVNEIGGKVTFHTDSLGDVTLAWDKIKELHTTEKFGVLEQSATLKGKHATANTPTGTVDVSDGKLTVNAEGAPATIPVAKAEFVMDEAVLRKQVLSEPGFFAGWNGAATAGATQPRRAVPAPHRSPGAAGGTRCKTGRPAPVLQNTGAPDSRRPKTVAP